MKYYTKQGDMWDSIAKKAYGSERYATELARANPEYSTVYIFGSEVELELPDIDTQTLPELLPPWRRKSEE